MHWYIILKFHINILIEVKGNVTLLIFDISNNMRFKYMYICTCVYINFIKIVIFRGSKYKVHIELNLFAEVIYMRYSK